MANDKDRFSITGSTVGVMAVGAGAKAPSSVGNAPIGRQKVYNLEFKVTRVTEEQLLTWFRGAIRDIQHNVCNSYAHADGAAYVAWNLTEMEPK